MITKEELKKMSEIDLRSVDREQLVDIKDVVIDLEQSPSERVASYIEQIKNPYCYLDNGVVVKLSFTQNGPKLKDCLSQYISTSIYFNQ